MANIKISEELFCINFIFHNESTFNLEKKKNTAFSNIRNDLINICILNKQLKFSIKKLLGQLVDSTWVERSEICQDIKNQIINILKVMKVYCSESKIKKKHLNNLRKWKKKKKNQTWLRKKENYQDNKNRLIIKINKWMEIKKNEITGEKDKEIFHKNADYILAEIRAKRSDTKKFLTLLQELKNLRKVKVSIARVEGKIIASEADKFFNSIIDKLLHQWIHSDRDYFLEEKGLKLMLTNDTKLSILRNDKNFFLNWIHLLFKNDLLFNRVIKHNPEILIQLRMMWDKLIDNPNGLKICIGWILPSESSFINWMKYL